MKINIRMVGAFYALIAGALIFSSCKKDNVDDTTDSGTSGTIAVAATLSAAPVPDSVYLSHSCGNGGRRDSIGQADLPAAVISYLDANYAGYTFHKAFAVKDSTATVTGYVAVIYYNDKPVGLLFDTAGTFVRELEQKKGRRRH